MHAPAITPQAIGIGEAVHVAPYTVLVDHRENHPYTFAGMRTRASERPPNAALVVLQKMQHLPTGDYTVAGLESQVAIERKSLEDLYSTLGSNRERFEREHQRLAEIPRRCVLIEATWEQIIAFPPAVSRLRPESVLGTAIAWSQRYGVPWLAIGSRRLCEVFALRFLERAFLDC